MRLSARLKYKSQPVSVPSRLDCAEKILIIIPEDTFMALEQVETVVSIVSHYSQAEISLFCEQSTASYFKKIKGITSIITYAESERFLFSRDFRTYGKMLAREQFDVLFFLEREAHPAFLNLVVQSSIPLRICYEGTADFPFFNFRVRPSSGRTYIGDQNRYMLDALNIPVQKNIRWSASKQSREELEQLLLEYKISSDASLLLIDAFYLFNLGTKEWARSLIDAVISSHSSLQVCLYASDTDNAGFVNLVKSFSAPVISDLSSSRIAALVNRSSIVVSGKALLFQIARLLGVAAVGIFTELDGQLLYRETDQTRAAFFAKMPDENTVQKVIDSIDELV